jgi:hypothetical protein
VVEHQTASAEASALFPRPEVTVGVPSLICGSRVRVPPLPSTFVGGRFMEGVAQFGRAIDWLRPRLLHPFLGSEVIAGVPSDQWVAGSSPAVLQHVYWCMSWAVSSNGRTPLAAKAASCFRAIPSTEVLVGVPSLATRVMRVQIPPQSTISFNNLG